MPIIMILFLCMMLLAASIDEDVAKDEYLTELDKAKIVCMEETQSPAFTVTKLNKNRDVVEEFEYAYLCKDGTYIIR